MGYDRFECAPGLRLQGLTVYGVVAVILAQAVQSFLVVAP